MTDPGLCNKGTLDNPVGGMDVLVEKVDVEGTAEKVDVCIGVIGENDVDEGIKVMDEKVVGIEGINENVVVGNKVETDSENVDVWILFLLSTRAWGLSWLTWKFFWFCLTTFGAEEVLIKESDEDFIEGMAEFSTCWICP